MKTFPMVPQNKAVVFEHWGMVSYEEAWNRQEALAQRLIRQKLAKNKGFEGSPCPNYLIFCHHPHVYTLGRNGNMQHLLLSREACEARGISFFRTNRGGDITYHGPGQVVVYPILDLDNFFTDVHRYVRSLEEAIISTLHTFGVSAFRREGLTGVWTRIRVPRKIAAIGIRISRWVTMHGLALNVSTDLSYFAHIMACGIDRVVTTSLARELGQQAPALSEVERVLGAALVARLGMLRL